jgi:hypothetical protein
MHGETVRRSSRGWWQQKMVGKMKIYNDVLASSSTCLKYAVDEEERTAADRDVSPNDLRVGNNVCGASSASNFHTHRFHHIF